MSDTYTYTDARKNLAEILDRATNALEAITITRRNSKDAVILSKEEYTSMLETIHLFSSPANAKRLLEAMSDSRKGKTKPMTIEELKKSVGYDRK
jgi:antitoxin YefM